MVDLDQSVVGPEVVSACKMSDCW